MAARGRPRWSTRGVRQPGTWSGERERGVRERAAGQSSPVPAPVAAGRSSLARTGGRAELAFACTCGGRGAAALHAHPWRLGRSSPGARSRRPGGACLRPQRMWRSSSARTLVAAGQSSSAPEPAAAGRSSPTHTGSRAELPRARSQPRRPLRRRRLHRPRPCSRTPRCFNPAAGYPPQFPSLCHRRTTPPRRHNPATPFTLHPNWLCQCVRLILVHLLHRSIAPRSTGAAHPPRSSSRPAGALSRTALPWPAFSGRVLFILAFVSCSP